MAINIVEILGTDSIASSRITINNNYAEIKDKVDPILDTYDTSNGVINISDLPNGQLIAKRLTVTTAGIDVQGGAVTIGSSSNVILNGGNLQLTTGAASFGGGIDVNSIDLTDGSVIEESGDLNFIGSSVNDSSVKRTLYIGTNNSNASILLDVLTSSIEVFLVNDKPTSMALTFNAGTGIFGNGLDTDFITLQSGGTVTLKFIIPDGSVSGKWWVMGGESFSIDS